MHTNTHTKRIMAVIVASCVLVTSLLAQEQPISSADELDIVQIEAMAKADAREYLEINKWIGIERGFYLATIGCLAGMLTWGNTQNLHIIGPLTATGYVGLAVPLACWNADMVANTREAELKRRGMPNENITAYRSVYLKEIRKRMLRNHVIGGAGSIAVAWSIIYAAQHATLDYGDGNWFGGGG